MNAPSRRVCARCLLDHSIQGDNRTFNGTVLGILNGTIQSNYELSDAEDESSEDDNPALAKSNCTIL